MGHNAVEGTGNLSSSTKQGRKKKHLTLKKSAEERPRIEAIRDRVVLRIQSHKQFSVADMQQAVQDFEYKKSKE